ncbi:hypothetical protein F4553_005507 [Allocatelliglobosispora scoriae]|uniref:Uncharacterized protein n=1 Tax=Allocatelliglobosispora scoriae TaxID=643052 RepID=A0A841BYS2_9ACTN|nr:hypothetical protein [Allocatelliglobosispora scoriae]MBB5872073.1 hypothetical protein [Allocatelliglobosispora scoriae]
MAGPARSAASLFRINPAGRVTPLVVSLTLVLAALISLLRIGRDGWSVLLSTGDVIVLDDARRRSIADGVRHPLAGGSDLLSRFVAELALQAPPTWVDGTFVLLSGVFTAALVLVVYAASAGVLPRTLQRLLVSVPLLMMPLAQDRWYGIPAVLGWQLLYAAFWAILWMPPSRIGRIIAPIVVGLAAFCLDMAWVLLPLLLLRLLLRRDASGYAAASLLLAGTAWQRLADRDDAPSSLIPGFERSVQARWIAEALPVTVAAVAVLVIVVLAAARVTSPRWLLAAVAAGHAMVLLAVTSTAAAYSGTVEIAVSMLLIVALVALTNPSGDLRVPKGAGIREVGTWLPVAGLTLLLAVAWTRDLSFERTVVEDAAVQTVSAATR